MSASDRPPEDGFFARWSRRKSQAREAREESQQAVATGAAEKLVPAAANTSEPKTVEPVAAPAAVMPAPAAEPLPTLDDVAMLTPASDFRRFVTRQVEAPVRNAALKKLFADPHFNVMDGLDIYIDDYGRPDPLDASLLKQMAQAHFLGLVEDDSEGEGSEGQGVKETGTPGVDVSAMNDASATEAKAIQAPGEEATQESIREHALDRVPERPQEIVDEDLDLRLQSHHAAEPADAGGAAPGVGEYAGGKR